jgi:hypothetical protein
MNHRVSLSSPLAFCTSTSIFTSFFIALSQHKMVQLLSTLALASVAVARNIPKCDPTYDYVIVGAGTSGLVIANRLSELNVTVAVIEAGDSQLNNVNVSNPSGYGLAFGTEIDWAYQTTGQAYAGNTTQTMRAGKAIGGTSTINGTLQLCFLIIIVLTYSRNGLYPSRGHPN